MAAHVLRTASTPRPRFPLARRSCLWLADACKTPFETFRRDRALIAVRKQPAMELRNSMKNKIVLITGAKGGLGSFITQAFLATGASVVGASRSISAEDFPQANFVPLPSDFTKVPNANDAVQSVVSRFGGLDVLVHVMGGFAGGKTVAETDDATWEQMRDLNLTSAF